MKIPDYDLATSNVGLFIFEELQGDLVTYVTKRLPSTSLPFRIPNVTADPDDPAVGDCWLRTDLV